MPKLRLTPMQKTVGAAVGIAFGLGFVGMSLGFLLTSSEPAPFALCVGSGLAMALSSAWTMHFGMNLARSALAEVGEQLEVFRRTAQRAMSLRPQFDDGIGWVPPEREEGDELVEADMVMRDGERRPIIVLLKPDGRVFGFSGPLNGMGLQLKLGDPQADLPEPPT